MVPSGTELISGIVCEPTNVSANYLRAPELVIEIVGNGSAEEGPISHIIACPMYRIPTRTDSRTSREYERFYSLFLEILISLIDLQIAIEDMHIRLNETIEMR